MATPSQVAPQGHPHDSKAAIKSEFSTVSGHKASDWDSASDADDANGRKEDHKPLVSPSTNIKESPFGDFELVLADSFNFDGAFAFSTRYTMNRAPNPCLNIEGLGTVGLPLSAREALAIISVSKPVHGPKNDVTVGVREVSAENISFGHPHWSRWIEKTAGLVASQALVGDSTLKPNFMLKKLLIHDQTSSTTHYKESIDDEDRTSKIGDFIVILPSTFDGGMLELHHASQKKSFDLAQESGLMTSVVAAYSGVEHTLAGVTAGCRLSLVYEIVHPITAAGSVPVLPEMEGAMQKIRDILLSWKQDISDEAPKFLACLLQHPYAQAPTFHAESLAGADALLVTHLRPLARELEFSLHLVHFKVTVTAPAKAEGRHGGYAFYGTRIQVGGWGYGLDSEDDSDRPDDDEFEDDEESATRELSITQVVKLNGMPVDIDLALQINDLLHGSVTDKDPTSNELIRYGGTMGTRVKTYKRTALLIWPKNGELADSVKVGDVYDYAFQALRNSMTATPTPKDTEIIDRLLECCATRPQEAPLKKAVHALRETANRWNDVELFLRAVTVCGVDKNVDLLGVEGFVSAYQAFGWGALKDFCDKALKNDPSNARRRALLSRLTQMGLEEKDAEVSQWCTAQEDNLLRSLGQLDAEHIPWLMDIVKARGSQFFQATILPQLKIQTLAQEFWIPFIRQLKERLAIISVPDSDSMHELLVQCVAEAVQQLPAFPTKNAEPVYYFTRERAEPRKEKNIAEILTAIQLCLETRTAHLCTSIFTKMRDGARSEAFLAEHPPWTYYAELWSPVTQALQSASASDAAALETIFRPFFINVVSAMVWGAPKTSDGKKMTPCPLKEEHTSIIIAAARKAGGTAALRESLSGEALNGHESHSLQVLARLVAKEFPCAQLSDPTDVQAYNELLVYLVRAAIDSFNPYSATVPQYSGGFSDRGISPSDRMMRLVRFCFEVGAINECDRLLVHLVAPPTGCAIDAHVSQTLAPFLPLLGEYLVAQRLDFQTEPFKKFCAAVVRVFAEKVMGPRPSEVVTVAQVQAFGCRCPNCQQVVVFFLGAQQTFSFKRKQKIRKHIEHHLEHTKAWGVTWETPIAGTLQITKSESMVAIGLWTQNSEKGKKFLSYLGDVSKQKIILGEDYSWVHARIHGTERNPQHPAPTPQGSAIQSSVKRPASPVASGSAPLKKAKTS